MSYERPAHDEIAFSWQGAPDYTRPDADAISFSWVDEVGASGVGEIAFIGDSISKKSHHAIGIGIIDVLGDSPAGKEIFDVEGVGAVGVVGDSQTQYIKNHVGVGEIGIVGDSLTYHDKSHIGVGEIGIVGDSLTETNYRAVGTGKIGIAGDSTIKLTPQVTGVGQIALLGDSLTALDLTPIPIQWLSTHYRCYLTGNPDIELPIRSVQIRYNREPDYRVYASVVVPDLVTFQAAINERQNGRLKVFRIYNLSDGSAQQFLMVDVPLNTIRSDEGARAGRTGTLSGSAVISTPPNTFTIALKNPMFRGESGDGLRYRAELDPRLRPGDTAQINGDTFTVRTIAHIIDTRTTIMEIAA